MQCEEQFSDATKTAIASAARDDAAELVDPHVHTCMEARSGSSQRPRAFSLKSLCANHETLTLRTADTVELNCGRADNLGLGTGATELARPSAPKKGRQARVPDHPKGGYAVSYPW